MHRKGSILLPILIVFFIISLVAAAGLFYLYQKEYAQNIAFQAQILELENRQSQTTRQLDESKKVATELQLKLQETISRMDALAAELTAEKTAHAETSNKLEKFKVDLSEQKALRQDLENRLSQVQGDSRQIKEQIKIMQQQKATLEEKIKDLETGAAGVELGTVVVNPEVVPTVSDKVAAGPKVADKKVNPPVAKAAKAAKKEQPVSVNALEGKVMIVNKEFNFVVINLGSKDKVSVGDAFLVSRGNKAIGDVKIEKVHEAMSAAGFDPQLKDLIKENDLVTQKTK